MRFPQVLSQVWSVNWFTFSVRPSCPILVDSFKTKHKHKWVLWICCIGRHPLSNTCTENFPGTECFLMPNGNKFKPTKYRKIQCSSFSLPLPLSTSLSAPLSSFYSSWIAPQLLWCLHVAVYATVFYIFEFVHLKKFYSSVQYLLSTYRARCIVLSAWKMYLRTSPPTPQQTAQSWVVQKWE